MKDNSNSELSPKELDIQQFETSSLQSAGETISEDEPFAEIISLEEILIEEILENQLEKEIDAFAYHIGMDINIEEDQEKVEKARMEHATSITNSNVDITSAPTKQLDSKGEKHAEDSELQESDYTITKEDLDLMLGKQIEEEPTGFLEYRIPVPKIKQRTPTQVRVGLISKIPVYASTDNGARITLMTHSLFEKLKRQEYIRGSNIISAFGYNQDTTTDPSQLTSMFPIHTNLEILINGIWNSITHTIYVIPKDHKSINTAELRIGEDLLQIIQQLNGRQIVSNKIAVQQQLLKQLQ